MSPTNTPTFSVVTPRLTAISLPEIASPCVTAASTGRNTRASTIARSSTMSQPTAIRPCSVSSSLRCSRARNRTTVLATDMASPNTSPAGRSQPQPIARAAPIAVATAICAMAPGRAIRRTRNNVSTEKCRPTPNINRMTPISASSAARLESPTKPGVKGPTATPATRYPSSGGRRSFAATKPKPSASTNPIAISAIRADSWGIGGLLQAGKNGRPLYLRPATM